MTGVEAIVIGTSAGAVESLMSILPSMSADAPFPVVVVVHMPSDKKSLLPELFEGKCRVTVKEAEDKEALQNGVIYFAPPSYHLLVEPDFRLSLSFDEPVMYSRPSIDVLFESASDAYGSGLLGIVLSGANSDGAGGLRTIIKRGGRGLIQDPETAYCATMPQAAIDACPNADVMPLDEIALVLGSLTNERTA